LPAGDVIIARIFLDGDRSFRLRKGTPSTLVYGIQYPCPISFILLYYGFDFAEEATIISYSPPELDAWPYSQWPSSYADLENTRRVQRYGKYCRDILFSYENGGQRVLGQCRIYGLYVDQYPTFKKPMSFCFKRIKVESGANRTMVQFGDDLVHSHGEGDSWICFLGVGTLGFYFRETGESTWLSVYQKNSIIAIE
jgi:hypothetical protein